VAVHLQLGGPDTSAAKPLRGCQTFSTKSRQQHAKVAQSRIAQSFKAAAGYSEGNPIASGRMAVQ